MCDTCVLLGSAIEEGRINAGAVNKWKRMFERAPKETEALLADQAPTVRRLMENRRILSTVGFANLDGAMVDRHERELAAALGVKPEEVL
jgi:hypothetical protein